jgi:phytoene desaturase
VAELRDSYDAVVIGAGIGGLACGALLAKNRRSVLVVEQSSQPGGCCASFEHGGYLFDKGICYLMGCEPGGAIYEILEELGLRQKIELVKMEPAIRIIGTDYELRISSTESLEHRLIRLFPMEAMAIREFVAECRATTTEMERFSQKSLDLMNIWQKMAFRITFFLRHRRMMKYMRKSWQEVVNSFFQNAELRAIVLSTYPYNGLGAMAGVMMVLGNTDGFYYPKGGLQALADLLSAGLRMYNGDLALDTMVSRIIMEGDRVAGVELSDGRRVKAGHVVSNVDARQTFLKLVGEERLPLKFRRELDESQLSPSAFIVSLGVRLNLKAMGFDGVYNIYNPGNDIDELFGTDPEKCIVSINMHSIIDPAQAPDSNTAVQLVAMLPYDMVKDWRAAEEAIADKLIASAEKVIPRLSEHIICKHIISPLTFEQSTLNSRGAPLGWQLTPGGKIRSQKTPVKNLYQAGHWTFPGGGVSQVVTSGRNAAQLVLRGG